MLRMLLLNKHRDRPFHHPDRSDWYLGYPECALNRQSPINIAAPIVSPREVRGKKSPRLGKMHLDALLC